MVIGLALLSPTDVSTLVEECASAAADVDRNLHVFVLRGYHNRPDHPTHVIALATESIRILRT